MITCFWWLAITAWKTPLLPGPFCAPPPRRGGYSLRLDKGQEDLQLFVVWKAFQSPENLLLLTSVLKVKPVIRCRIRKGCPLSLSSQAGERTRLLSFLFFVAWSIIHRPGSPGDWKLALFFLHFWKLRTFLAPGLRCFHFLKHGFVEERC